MNEDYLWDKSGEPDPQIQELEEILGTLRYQPKPLEIPGELVVVRRRDYRPLLAIAATVIIALLAVGLWLRVSTRNSAPQEQSRTAPLTAPPTVPADTSPSSVAENSEPNEATLPVKTPIEKRNATANSRPRHRPSPPTLAKREREEALAAKEQLMLALRLASEKLNLAQRKTQGPAPSNQIRNQHKIG